MGYTNNQFKKLSQSSYTEQEKTLEKLSLAAMLVAIIVLFITAFFGLNYGIFFFFMELYFAMQGLRSTKRGKIYAYITFGLAAVTVIIIVISMAIERGLIIL